MQGKCLYFWSKISASGVLFRTVQALGGIVTTLKMHRLPENYLCTSRTCFPKEYRVCACFL